MVALVVLVIAGVGVAVGVRGTPAPVGRGGERRARWSARPTRSRPPGTAPGSRPRRACRPASSCSPTRRPDPSRPTITAVTDSGATAHTAVAVPARGVVAPPIPALSSGSWESETVITSGGGVAVTQAVHSSLGWSQAPCQSTTSAQWYFAGGSTAAANPLYVSLLNPTSTPVVVDLSFMTPAGTVHPINYQGIVLPAGQVAVENVASEVQNDRHHQHGRRDPDRARRRLGGAGARGCRAGRRAASRSCRASMAPQSHWAIPQAQEVRAAPPRSTSSTRDGHRDGDGAAPPALGPAGTADRQGPARHDLGPRHERTDADPRRTRPTPPPSTPRGARASSSAGRSSFPTSATPPPQAGMARGGGRPEHRSRPRGEWVVPPPGTSASPAVSGAAPAYLALFNTSATSETYTAGATTAVGQQRGRHGHAGGRAPRSSVYGAAARRRRARPDHGAASGPMAVSEDVGPVGGRRRGSMPGHPAGRRHRRLSRRAPTGCGAGSAATGRGRRARTTPSSSRAKSSGPARRITPSTPATKPPMLACQARTSPDSGSGLGAGAGGALADRHGQRRVRRLARQQLQLALQLLDLGLNGVQLLLHGQDVAHRRGLGQDGQVLLAAGLQRGDARLQVDVLAGDVGGLGREVRRLAERLGLLQHGGEVVHRHLQRDAARRGAAARRARLGLRVGHEAAVRRRPGWSAA